jgi:hypothetical protein
MVFVPLFRPTGIMFAALRWRVPFVFLLLLLNVAFLSLGITFVVSSVVLCVGKHCCTQQHSQY